MILRTKVLILIPCVLLLPGVTRWICHCTNSITAADIYAPVYSRQQFSPTTESVTPERDRVCRDVNNLCLHYLSSKEETNFTMCTKKARNAYGEAFEDKGTCHFMNGTGRKPVALASFEGSGNTWVRGLLEKATGICTGAIYCDNPLRVNGFRGEGVMGSSVLAIKTHLLKNDVKFGAAILIIRNPKEAFVAEWNRRQSRKQHIEAASITNIHVLSVNKDYFGTNRNWSLYVHSVTRRWWQVLLKWAEFGKSHPLHVVYYEDLKTNASAEVEKMLTFLRVPSSPAEVARRLEEDFIMFQREHSTDFQQFTQLQEAMVNRTVQITYKSLRKLGYRNDHSICRIQRYLK